MKIKKGFRFLGVLLIIVGIFIIMAQPFSMTGAVIDPSSVISRVWFFVGISLIFGGALLVTTVKKDLEERLEGIDQIAESHNWINYPITPKSERIDKRVDDETGKATGLGYLNEEKDYPEPKKTPIQKRIEKMVTGGKKILPYIGKEDKSLRMENKGETVNRRNSYAEQFYEPHAAGGGRIIDVQSHLSRGKLKHFNELANGDYIWIVDSEGRFIVGNRGEVNESGDFNGMVHDMFQMPLDLGSGKRHKKIDKRKTTLPHSTLARGLDVYGAGEVTIKDGLIYKYNSDTGHYAKLETDLGGPREPDNFVRQSVSAFKTLCKSIGWKEVEGGAKYDSKHHELSL
jgi:hypothetical protein